MRTRSEPGAGRRIAEYMAAVLAGVFLSWTLLSLTAYFNRPYVDSRREIAQALGLSQLGWLGPLLILTVASGLAFYLARVGSSPKEEQPPSPARCISCGQKIVHDWKLCPYCGSLVGTIRDPRDHAG